MGERRHVLVCGTLLLASACSFDTSAQLEGGVSDASVGALIDAAIMDDATTPSFDATVAGEPDAMPVATTGTLYSLPVPEGPPVSLDGVLGTGWPVDSFVEFAIDDAEQMIAIEDTYVPDATLRFASMYDDQRIYFFLEVQDSLIVNDSTNAYNDDSIELYFDGLNNRNGAFGTDDFFVAMGTDGFYATGDNSINIGGAVLLTPSGYNIEIAFNRADFGDATNTVLGFNIGINDDDGEGGTGIDMYGLWHLPSTAVCGNDCCAGFEPVGNYAWCDTTRLGQLVLMPEPE